MIEADSIRVFYNNPEIRTYQPLYGASGIPASREYYKIGDDAIRAVAVGNPDARTNKIIAFRIGEGAGAIVLDMSAVERDAIGLPKPSEIARVAKEQLGRESFDIVLSVPFIFL